jgi:PAS domain S-box-containing protein
LKRNENQLQAILNGSQGIVFIKDLTGRFTLINQKLEELHGITCDEIREKRTRIYFPQSWLIIIKHIPL